MRPALSALLVAAVLAPSLAVAAGESPKSKTTQELLDASQPSDWRTLDPANTLYLELANGRVVIELAPGFAPAHVANIRTLAHEGYWDGMSINRSQDNFVVQWGDGVEARFEVLVREFNTVASTSPFAIASSSSAMSTGVRASP